MLPSPRRSPHVSPIRTAHPQHALHFVTARIETEFAVPIKIGISPANSPATLRPSNRCCPTMSFNTSNSPSRMTKNRGSSPSRISHSPGSSKMYAAPIAAVPARPHPQTLEFFSRSWEVIIASRIPLRHHLHAAPPSPGGPYAGRSNSSSPRRSLASVRIR